MIIFRQALVFDQNRRLLLLNADLWTDMPSLLFDAVIVDARHDDVQLLLGVAVVVVGSVAVGSVAVAAGNRS